jgi:Na+/proline symporter
MLFQAFNIILQIGAGTGLIFILRWFWWRINAFSELSGMVVSFIVALYFELIYKGAMADWQKLVIGVGITTVSWLAVTFLTQPTSKETLQSFYRLVHPGGPGWKKVLRDAEAQGVPFRNPERAAISPWAFSVCSWGASRFMALCSPRVSGSMAGSFPLRS